MGECGDVAPAFIIVRERGAVAFNTGFRIGVKHRHQAARLGKRQWTNQNRIDHGEDRRVGSEAEREREPGLGGEAGVLQQLAKREFEIIHSAMPPADRLSPRGARAASRREARPVPRAA